MQRFKFIDFMVIEVRFFKKKKKMNKKMVDKMWKSLFQILCISHITLLPIFVYWLFFKHSLLSIIKSEINLKLKVNILIYGIDHTNPYVHSTTVMCDIYVLVITPLRDMLLVYRLEGRGPINHNIPIITGVIIDL